MERRRPLWLAGLAFALMLVLAGCGPSGDAGAGTPATTSRPRLGPRHGVDGRRADRAVRRRVPRLALAATRTPWAGSTSG